MRTRKKSPWPIAATRLADLLPRHRFHPAVLQWAERSRRDEVWGVAFSGGADSLALLLLLWAHWREHRKKIVAFHFNHRLRGRESAADVQFCRKVCAGLGIRCRVGRWARPPARRLKSNGSGRLKVSEAEARAARHEFFSSEMQALGTRILWVAHQQNDIAESMLMRLARGSGVGGLAAPRPVQAQADRRIHLRPLLTLKKTELNEALRAAGARWREDSSNGTPDHFRNRVRSRVIPAWTQAAGRDAIGGAALARERLDEDEQALEAWLDRLAPVKRGQLDLAVLAGLPRAIIRRALHRWLLSLKPSSDLARQGFEALLAIVESGRATRFSLGKAAFAVVRNGKLTFKKA